MSLPHASCPGSYEIGLANVLADAPGKESFPGRGATCPSLSKCIKDLNIFCLAQMRQQLTQTGSVSAQGSEQKLAELFASWPTFLDVSAMVRFRISPQATSSRCSPKTSTSKQPLKPSLIGRDSMLTDNRPMWPPSLQHALWQWLRRVLLMHFQDSSVIKLAKCGQGMQLLQRLEHMHVPGAALAIISLKPSVSSSISHRNSAGTLMTMSCQGIGSLYSSSSSYRPPQSPATACFTFPLLQKLKKIAKASCRHVGMAQGCCLTYCWTDAKEACRRSFAPVNTARTKATS